MKYYVVIFILLILLSCSEEPTRDNPYDMEYFKTVAPELEMEILDINSISLTWEWEYEIDIIEGFRIEKKAGGGNWQLYADNISPDLREWIDNYPVYMDSYRIKAYYQEYESLPSNIASIFLDWCFVSAGDFTWGEDDEIQTINYDYEIMKYEVTNFQYVVYLEESLAAREITVTSSSVTGYYEGDQSYAAGDYEFYDLDGDGKISWDGSNFNIEEGYNDHPVLEVSWFGANAFALYYDVRLPTEQEWEKAARGMTGYEYPWGDNLSGDRANYYDSGDPWDNGTTPVGYYNGENGTIDSPSAYGCYDMCGNVFDWTDSWISGSLTYRVLRGGSWHIISSHDLFRSWCRGGGNPTSTYYDFGFRCARTLD